VSLISRFGRIRNNQRLLEWSVGGVTGGFETRGKIVDSAYSPSSDLILVLVQSAEVDFANRLIGITVNGQIKFDVCEPEGHYFYYLASHINCETSVICSPKSFGLDWFYSVNPDSGELTALNRAY